jgi:hypothetical protein
MRYRFVDEIVSLALDGAPRIEVAKRFEPGNDVFGGPQGPERVPDSMLLELMAMTGWQLIFEAPDIAALSIEPSGVEPTRGPSA